VLSDARVDDPVAGARELRRVLRPGGTLLLHLPAYEWLRSGHDVVARTGRRYTRRRARALLREAGFAPVHLSYRVSAAFPLAALVRLLRRGGASTDVGPVPAPLNALLKTLGRLENRVATRVPLPFGLSVLAIAAAGAPARPTLYERALAHRRLVALGQFAVTGERLPRRHRLLAEALREGEHRFVVDLGCGNAPLLRFAAPERYVGIDAHEPSLAAGRHEHSGPGREFVLGELTEVDLTPFRGADAVVVSSVTHHLPDGEVVRLLDRVAAQVAPRRILLQDAQPTGPLGPLVEALDDGDHLRPRAELERLLRPHFDTRLLWTYDNPLRSFHQFLLELRPRASG
jgi:SAM-dependent methyltransferase